MGPPHEKPCRIKSNCAVYFDGKAVVTLRFLFSFLKKYWHTGLLAILLLIAEIVIDLY